MKAWRWIVHRVQDLVLLLAGLGLVILGAMVYPFVPRDEDY